MTSTRGRRPFDLPPSVLYALEENGFSLIREASVGLPPVFTHRLAPAMTVTVAMSARTGSRVLVSLKNIPAHLVGEFAGGDHDVEGFVSWIEDVNGAVQLNYDRGPRVIDRTGLTN